MKEQDRNKFLDMASNLIEKIDNFSEIFLNAKRLKKYTKNMMQYQEILKQFLII